MLRLTDYPQYYRYGHLKESLLPLRTNGLVLLPATWFSLTTFLPHQEMGQNELLPTVIIGGWAATW